MANMNDNINMDGTKAWSVNARHARFCCLTLIENRNDLYSLPLAMIDHKRKIKKYHNVNDG
jgi:hypothetical protein